MYGTLPDIQHYKNKCIIVLHKMCQNKSCL